jgi:hypothetical protein
MAGITDARSPALARSPRESDVVPDLEMAKVVADFTVAFGRWSRSLIEAHSGWATSPTHWR